MFLLSQRSLLPPELPSPPADSFLGNIGFLRSLNYQLSWAQLSQVVCQFNVQETQELSDHSPGVQVRSVAHLCVACPLLRCHHLFWVALLPAVSHPSLGRDPIRFYKSGRVRPVENGNGNAQNNKGSSWFS